MTTERPGAEYDVRFHTAARRAISERLPERVAAAVLDFCEEALATNPAQVGEALGGPLLGCDAARRGTYRIIYRIDEVRRVVEVVSVGHRSDIYRTR